jgi:hypothetical protein
MNHNLDIHHYSFVELLGLFDLTYQISIDDLKRAKKKVLMSHPDKSKLPPEYFLFYKKAFDIVYDYYCNNNKQSVEVNALNAKYNDLEENILNESSAKKVSQIINTMDKSAFNDKFNKLFEKNMVHSKTNKNEWFTKTSEVEEHIPKASNPGSIGKIFEQMKQQNNSIVKHRDFNHMCNHSLGTDLYEDDDENNSAYVTSDPFSKLKYDDLRKVHKDETIFAVSESDYKNVRKYASVDEINRVRTSDTLTPLEKTHAEQMLYEKDRIFREKMAEKKLQSTLQTDKYAEKNRNVLATFLRIQNV